MKYTIVFDDGVRTATGEFEAPERLPQPGDIYEWTQPGRTLGDYDYRKGETMLVLERTGHAPFHRTSSLGNLLVRGPHGTSVWACFESAIVDGSLKLVEKL